MVLLDIFEIYGFWVYLLLLIVGKVFGVIIFTDVCAGDGVPSVHWSRSLHLPPADLPAGRHRPSLTQVRQCRRV